MNDATFDWKRFHAYRVFDEFLEQFILQRKSYVTKHPDTLDLAAAFEDIRKRFVDDYDDSAPQSMRRRSRTNSMVHPEATKIVFANIEYLWAMPMGNLKREDETWLR